MKKLLALVMALVMSLSLVTISSNAAFGDQEKIEHTDAVQIMASLGILAGKEDGNYDPEGTLTRAEAAKIICYMLIGTESACKLTPNGTQFTDVAADHWAAPYIAYCDAQGIINGNGDGTFDPEGKLTGYAFGKMLLVAAGFDGDYTGPAWQANVAADLEKSKKQDNEEKGLKEDLKDIVLANEISRDEAAQMAFNTLFFVDKDTVTYKISLTNGSDVDYGKAQTKEFDSYSEAYSYMLSCGVTTEDNIAWARKGNDGNWITDGDGNILAYASEADATAALGTNETAAKCNNLIYEIKPEGGETLAKENFNVDRISGVVIANQETSLNDYTTISGLKNYKLNYETGLDMIGHCVVAYYDVTLGDDGFWAYDEGDKEEEKGLCFTMVDKTTVVEVAEDTNGLSENAVKSLLGVTLSNSEFTPDNSLTNYSNAQINTDQPIRNKTGHDDKYNVAAGKYLTIENSDGKVYVYGYVDDTSCLANFHVELDDAENKYYTVTVDTTEVVKVTADEDECFNTVNQDIDWLSYIGKGNDYKDNKYRGDVVFAMTQHGTVGHIDAGRVQQWRLDLAEVETVTGKPTKVVTKNLGDDNEVVQIYVDGTAYDVNYKPEAIGANVADNIYTVELESTNLVTTHIWDPSIGRDGGYKPNPDLGNVTANDKTQVFFLLNGKIVAFVNEDNSTDTKMFVPVGIFAIEVDDTKDGYGKSTPAYDRYEFILQGVDANGAEVKINLDVADLFDDSNQNWIATSDNFLNTFFAGNTSVKDAVDSVTGYSKQLDKAAAALFAIIDASEGGYAPANRGTLLFYKDAVDGSNHNSNYTKFTSYVEEHDKELKVTLTSDPDLNKDSGRFTVDSSNSDIPSGSEPILLGNGYTVITRNSEMGNRLKVATSENTYSKIKSGAILYATRNDTNDKYTLKYVFVESSTTSVEDLIFVPETFTTNNPVRVTYQQNGRDKTETFYEETIYDGAEKKTIYVEGRVANTGVGLYEYTYDDDSGAYTAFNQSEFDTMVIAGIESENKGVSFNTLQNVENIYDKDLSKALIVNTTDFNINTDDLGGDNRHVYFAVVKFDEDVYDSTTHNFDRNAADKADVESVYIYAVAPKITLTNSANKDAKVTFEYDTVADQCFITYTFEAGTDLSKIRVNMSSAAGIAGVKNGVNDLSSIASWFMIYEDNCERIPARIVVESAT